jgi:ADP-heptose:LPS heptosyltransferase
VQSNRERGNRVLRFLDRFLGIPLLFFLGLFRWRRPCPESPRQIAILKTAAIGDTVLISAIIDDLKAAYPESCITFFCGASNEAAARMLDGLSEVVRIPVASPLKALRMMHRDWDLLLDFGQWPRLDALLACLSGARFTIGFRTPGQHRHFLFDAAVQHRDDRHEMENFRALLVPLGIRGRFRPRIPHRDVVRDPDKVVLHLFAGGLKSHLKEWPDESWLALMDTLTDAGKILFLTGSRENGMKARSLADRAKHPERVRSVAGEMTLPEVVDLLAEALILVTVNTGIMHLAAAIGCPLIALNGPTSVKRWGPYSENSVALQSPRACSPCLNLGFEYACPENHCMRAITVSSVLDACSEMKIL